MKLLDRTGVLMCRWTGQWWGDTDEDELRLMTVQSDVLLRLIICDSSTARMSMGKDVNGQ